MSEDRSTTYNTLVGVFGGGCFSRGQLQAFADYLDAQQALLPSVPASTSYADDAAAAAGGVPVGGIYRNGSVVQCRIA